MTPSAKDGHVTSEGMSAYLDRRMTTNERDEFQDHLSSCDDCRETVLGAGRVLGARQRQRTRRLSLAAAAAGIAVLLFMRWPDGPQADRLRGEGADRSRLTAVTTDGSSILRDDPLVWRAAPDVLIYRFTLSTTQGEELWSTSLTDTVLVVPGSVTLEARQPYLWSVDALREDGQSQATGFHRVTFR